MGVQTIILSNRKMRYLPGLMDSYRRFTWLEPGIILDDSGDKEHRRRLESLYPDWSIRKVGKEPKGYNAAMQKVWSLAEESEFVFLLEEDFRLERRVPMGHMTQSLDLNPHIAQFCLLRQPWFGNEIEAGGVLPAMEAQGFTLRETPGWIEQRSYFSCNPCVFRGGDWVRNHPWPEGEGSEYAFSRHLFDTEQNTVAAYWGTGDVWVQHVGERNGFGY